MFILKLAIVLIAAQIGSYVCRKLKQPTVLGQLLAGVLIGPSVLGLLNTEETFLHISEIGVIFLMFLAGLETDINDLIESGKTSTLIALGGVVVPLFLGVGTAMLFGRTFIEGLFIGIILTATSVSISVETLREIDKLRTKQGIAILGAAVIDDVLGIVLLSLVTGFVKPGAIDSFFMVLLKIIVFFILSFVIGFIVIRIAKGLFKTKDIQARATGIGLIFCLLMAFVSEELGVAAITGSYVAGIILSSTPYRHKVSQGVQELSYLFFIPIFFVVTGMKVDVSNLLNDWMFGVALLVGAIIGKIVGCGFVARLVGFTKRQATQIGIGMVPRGEVVLIIANIGSKLGVVPDSVFASMILMILATAIFTPPLLKHSFQKDE